MADSTVAKLQNTMETNMSLSRKTGEAVIGIKSPTTNCNAMMLNNAVRVMPIRSPAFASKRNAENEMRVKNMTGMIKRMMY